MSAIGRRFSRHASRRLQRGYINIGVRKLLLFGAKPFSIADLFKNGEAGAHFEAYDPSTLLARRNLLTFTEFPAGLANLSVPPPNASATVLAGYDGAIQVSGVESSAQDYIKSMSATSPSALCVMSIVVKMDDGGAPSFGSATLADPSNDFDINIGTSLLTDPRTYTITALGGGIYRVSSPITLNGAGGNFGLRRYPTNSGRTFKTTAWHFQPYPTSSTITYQKVTDWNTEYLAAAGSANVGLWQDIAATTANYAAELPVGKWMDWKGVKGAAGNHVVQATAGQRPILSARVNLLTKSEQFDDAAWSKQTGGTGSAAVVTANAGTDPNGNQTADRVVFARGASATSGDYSLLLQSATLKVGRGSLYVKSNTGSSQNVLVYLNGSATVSQAIVAVGAVWTRVTPADYTSDNTTVAIAVGTRGGTFGGDQNLDLLLWGGDLRAVDDGIKSIPAYQRVNTSTDYDTAGFPEYPRLDGIDDYLAATSGGGGTTGFLYCAAVTPTGGAGAARVLWADTGTNTGYRVQINTSNQLQIDAGNATAFTSIATVATLPLNETHVVTAWDDGANLNVQIDNGAVASIARPVVSAGSAAFTIGKSNTAASGNFTGRIYSTTYRQSDCGDAKRAKLKRYHGLLVGMAL